MAEASKGGVASGEVLETFLVGVFHKDSALDPEWANVLASALADRWTAYTAGDQQAGELVLPRPGLARDWWFVWLTTKGALLNPSAGGWDVRPEVQYLLMLGNLEERLQWDSVVKYIKEDIKGGLDERWARSSGALMRFPAVSRLHLLLNRYLAAVEKPTPHPPRASIEETRPLADGKPDMNADIVVEPSVLPGTLHEAAERLGDTGVPFLSRAAEPSPQDVQPSLLPSPLARLLFTGARAQFLKMGASWARAELQQIAVGPQPLLEEAERHLEARLSVARQATPALSRLGRQAVLILLAVCTVGLAAGGSARLIGDGLSGKSAGALSIGQTAVLALASVTLIALWASSWAWGKTFGGAPGLTASALLGPVTIALAALGSRWTGLVGLVVAASFALVIALGLRGTWVPSGHVEEEPEGLALARGTAASDWLLVNLENRVVPWSRSTPNLPLPVAVAIAPLAIAELHPELEDLAVDVARAEWDAYQRHYGAVQMLIDPISRTTRNHGTHFLLTHFLADGVAIRSLLEGL